jgi:hypothetical protein
MKKTVKARKHHGASLDLTIPAEVMREYNISEGDIFELIITEEKEPVLSYRRVYKI